LKAVGQYLLELDYGGFEGDVDDPIESFSGSNEGDGWAWKYALTASSIKLKADRPCNAHVAITVHMRSQLFRPLLLRVPCVT
jgi:hypothetical protein